MFSDSSIYFWSKKEKVNLGGWGSGKGQKGTEGATESILHGDRTPGLHTSTSDLLESDRPAGVALCLVTIGWASAGIRAQHP